MWTTSCGPGILPQTRCPSMSSVRSLWRQGMGSVWLPRRSTPASLSSDPPVSSSQSEPNIILHIRCVSVNISIAGTVLCTPLWSSPRQCLSHLAPPPPWPTLGTRRAVEPMCPGPTPHSTLLPATASPIHSMNLTGVTARAIPTSMDTMTCPSRSFSSEPFWRMTQTFWSGVLTSRHSRY